MSNERPTPISDEPQPTPSPEPDYRSPLQRREAPTPRRRKWRRVSTSINLITAKDLESGDRFEGRWGGTGIHEWPSGETTPIFTLETPDGPKVIALTAAH